MLNKKLVFLLLSLTIVIALFFIIYSGNRSSSSGTPSPKMVTKDEKVKVKYPQDYTLVLVGDSMTEYLGNSDELRNYLKQYYPDKTFEVLNYGFGSTNILSLQERLQNKTFYHREFRPITEIDFDLILIESFGHNPLSEYPLKTGLEKQREALGKATQTIKTENPKAKILFMATLAPSKSHYARGQRDLSGEQRKEWVDERISYIQNHIQFAQEQGIPVINIYEKSLKENGDVNLDYINQQDFIHPSPTGVIFISKEIADFIYQQQLLPAN